MTTFISDFVVGVKAIKAAEYEQLCAVVPKNAARAVFDHFHPANEEEKT